jgi:tetratricopeptide (TPR) repeat protein
LAGIALWMVSGCTAATPPIAPLMSGDFTVGEHAGHHQTGLEHLKAARYGLAVFELRKALRDNPRSIETLNAIGIAYDQLGRFDVSREYYDRALALDPNAVQTLNNLGLSATKQGNFASAVGWLERAQRQDPGSREVGENLADARDQFATLAAADPLLSAAAEAQPVDAWIERTDRLHQTLVTAAPNEILQTLAHLDIRPEVINVAGEPDLSLRERPRLDKGPSGAARSDARHDAPGDAPQNTAVEAATVPAPAGLESPGRDTGGAWLEISNGTGRRGMAARVRHHLAQSGIPADRLTNADHFAYTASAIFYRPGFEDSAAALGRPLPVQVDLIPDDDQSSDVRLRLGADLLDFDLQLLKKG